MPKGEGIARGYLNLADQTADKFITDPFGTRPGGRLYKTGDLARRLPDGDIEYLGRADEQVKIRGNRIEPGEIGNLLQQAPGVRQVVVVAWEDQAGNKRLVGYVVADPAAYDRDVVLDYAKDRLPDYMVPAALVEIERIPLNAIGKLDKGKLPPVDFNAAPVGAYAAPQTEAEMMLVQLWQDLLKIDFVGIHDNFFELGGDSIITIQVVSRARRLGYRLAPRDIFQHQTVSRLAAALRKAGRDAGAPGSCTGPAGLLPVQQWYLPPPANPSHFNQSLLLTIDKRVGAPVLEAAVGQLVAHHDALRFAYSRTPEGWVQQYKSPADAWRTEDLRACTPAVATEVMRERARHYQQSLDLGRGEVVRAVWMQMPVEVSHNHLLLVVHHLAVDGVSWRILLEDLDLLVAGAMRGETVALGAKTLSYRQWHETLVQYGESSRVQAQQDYWEGVVRAFMPLPADREGGGLVTARDTDAVTVTLGAEETAQLLHEAPGAYRTEVNDLLLAALAQTLFAWNGNAPVVVGLEGHGREDVLPGADTSRTVGWFTNLYPVLLAPGADLSPAALVKGTKEQLRLVPDKGLGYGVLKSLRGHAALAGRTPWDLEFNYLGRADNALPAGEWLKAVAGWDDGAVAPDMPLRSRLGVTAMVEGGKLVIRWQYSTRHYQPGTVARLAESYRAALRELTGHCVETKKACPVPTPSDFGLAPEVSYAELDAFLAETVDGQPRSQSVEGVYRLSALQEGMLFPRPLPRARAVRVPPCR